MLPGIESKEPGRPNDRETRAALRELLTSGLRLAAYAASIAKQGSGTKDALRTLVADFEACAERARAVLRSGDGQAHSRSDSGARP
jgi:hypothetical protein